MKTFILTLKQKSGLLTELQSDTIYGHFCWRLKERLGSEKLTEFISLYKNGNPLFLLSDGLLKVKNEIRFPRPFIFQKPETKDNKVDKILEFVERKKSKERNYVTLSELNKFLSTGKIELEQKDDADSNKKKNKGKKKEIEESLRVSVQIDRNSFASAEGKLFSYNPKFSRDDVSIVVLIKVLNEVKFEEYDCDKIVKDTFNIGFGKKKSSGYGQFEVLSLDEYEQINEPSGTNTFFVLGNYLPSAEDKVSPIGYDINTKYGKLGEYLALSNNPFKNPIVFLTAGSCFRTQEIKDFYGRVTSEGEISEANKFAVQFGMPFTLNFKLQ
ncbi:MAG: CRISPR-associated protein, Csm4 family [Ignavibacteriaceae bacterium]